MKRSKMGRGKKDDEKKNKEGVCEEELKTNFEQGHRREGTGKAKFVAERKIRKQKQMWRSSWNMNVQSSGIAGLFSVKLPYHWSCLQFL